MKKVFIPEIVTKGWLPGHSKPKPMPTTGTWRGYPVKDADDNFDKTHFFPMVREVYPSWFDAAQDPEVSLPVLMKNTKIDSKTVKSVTEADEIAQSYETFIKYYNQN